MSNYSINLETVSFQAFQALNDLDKSFVGTENYRGLAYFWSHEFKHWLRECTVAERQRVHAEWLERGLDFEAGMDDSVDCAPHWEVIKRVCKSIAA